MAAAVLMPKAGISVESCIITQWLKKPGDAVARGDILFSYETDKASFECESTEEGTLLEVFFEDGDEVPVLVNVCAVGSAGEDASGLRPDSGEDAPTAAPSAGTVSSAQTGEAPKQAESTGAFSGKISPRARNLARRQSIDPALASPTGPYGRVIERDIRDMMQKGIGLMTSAAYAANDGSFAGVGTQIGGRVGIGDLAALNTAASQAEDAPAFRDVAFTGIRRAIAKSMTASLSAIPQLTHNFSFDATELLAYRAKLKEGGGKYGLANITLGDMVMYGVSRLILSHPELNAHMPDANTIRYFGDVHLGMAVDTPRGLMVPTIKYANRMSLAQISLKSKELAKKAQSGELTPDEMSGATFTVSNLGILGVESFTPVINLPQTGILGVCGITNRPRERDGQIALYPAMGISLTYDHRAVDGAPASRFASELCKLLEQFTLLLAGG
ncbi:MAG: 2-oxo acid dehydrogenase subunit E2 [Oscillospiraceae bacterium]|nr:2-oxo acid dehydrogenase subunit E2 [Oscillospiraceae bacterium]